MQLTERHYEQAYGYSLLGLSVKQIAEAWGINGHRQPEEMLARDQRLREAMMRGKAEADSVVANALYRRATGYSHPEVKLFCHEGVVIREEVVKHYPPDTAACIFWLKNRRPDLWRDMLDIVSEHAQDVVITMVVDRDRSANAKTIDVTPKR